MRGYYILRGYAVAVGVGFIALSLAGFFGPSDLNLFSPPENVLHLGSGCLFLGGVWVADTVSQLRGVVGSMGVLLVVGKAAIVVERWAYEGLDYYIPPVGVVCCAVGVGSILVAALAGRELPAED